MKTSKTAKTVKTPSKSTKTSKPTAAKKGTAVRARAGAEKATKKPVRKKAAVKKAPVKKAPVPAGPIVDNPQAKALAHRIAQLALEKKASDVVVLDVRGKTSYADYVVLASGDSERQVSAMAEHVEVQLKAAEKQDRPLGTEGREIGNWVLLDYGDVVAHLFHTDQRAFYDLEGLWADATKETVS